MRKFLSRHTQLLKNFFFLSYIAHIPKYTVIKFEIASEKISLVRLENNVLSY